MGNRRAKPKRISPKVTKRQFHKILDKASQPIKKAEKEKSQA